MLIYIDNEQPYQLQKLMYLCGMETTAFMEIVIEVYI